MLGQRAGGSFAPPITEEQLAAYQALADSAEAEVREAMLTLHNCVAQWWELPESTVEGQPHASGRGVIVPLTNDLKAQLFDAIPWSRELKSMGELFEQLDAATQRDLRNAAFHLLWYVNELNLDREPISLDKL